MSSIEGEVRVVSIGGCSGIEDDLFLGARSTDRSIDSTFRFRILS